MNAVLLLPLRVKSESPCVKVEILWSQAFLALLPGPPHFSLAIEELLRCCWTLLAHYTPICSTYSFHQLAAGCWPMCFPSAPLSPPGKGLCVFASPCSPEEGLEGRPGHILDSFNIYWVIWEVWLSQCPQPRPLWPRQANTLLLPTLWSGTGSDRMDWKPLLSVVQLHQLPMVSLTSR